MLLTEGRLFLGELSQIAKQQISSADDQRCSPIFRDTGHHTTRETLWLC